MTLLAEPVTGKPFGFARLRQLFEAGPLQEGVLGAGDFKVTQRAAGGAGMFVDVAPGDAWVEVDSGVRQGYVHLVNDAVATLPVTPSHATLPRVDIVVAQYNDSSIPAGVGGDDPTFRVIAGVPTAGATLDNAFDGAHGGPALPADAVLLDHFLVPAAATSVTNGNMRDRRRWARGAYRSITRSGGTDLTRSSGTFALIDSTNVQPRVECSGAPLRVAMRGLLGVAASGDWGAFQLWVDGAAPAYPTTHRKIPPVLTNADGFEIVWTFTPAAGTHLIGPAWATQLNTSNITLVQSGAFSWDFTVEELVRPNADNT